MTGHKVDFHESLLVHFHNVFIQHGGAEHRPWTTEQRTDFFQGTQNDEGTRLPEDGLTYEEFLQYMSSSAANVAVQQLGDDRSQDLSWPLSSYFCSSSHNTYLTGDQLASDASVDAYKNVLLRGCRCIEIDVWDGTEHMRDAENALDEDGTRKLGFRLRTMLKVGGWALDNLTRGEKAKQDAEEMKARWASMIGVEPVVLHGHTLTKEVPFREVCKTVKEFAFTAGDLPLVVSLEVHCTPPQQEMMVQIMNEFWGEHLLDLEEVGEPGAEHPTLESLRRKILVKVKWAPAEGHLTPTSTADPDDSFDQERKETEKKKPAVKIVPSLSEMGVHTRGVSYKSMVQGEASMPGHIFSVSEVKFPKAFEKEPQLFFEHNKRHLMRTYPAGTRVDSSNMDPSGQWRRGAQFAALNWQTLDEGMMLNEAMFEGTKGYLLKPKGLRFRSAYEEGYAQEEHVEGPHVAASNDRLAITVLAAQNLPASESDDQFNSYVEFKLFAEKHHPFDVQPGTNISNPQTGSTIPCAGMNPDYGTQLVEFNDINLTVTPEMSFLVIKVMNDEPGRDPMLAWACIRVDRLRRGYRLIQLADAERRRKPECVLLVKIE